MGIVGRNWKRTVLLIATFFLPTILSFADEIQIPFAIDSKKFVEELKREGLNFDPHDNDAIGMLDNRGMKMNVLTYKTATHEQLDKIQRATWKSLRK